MTPDDMTPFDELLLALDDVLVRAIPRLAADFDRLVAEGAVTVADLEALVADLGGDGVELTDAD